jgi:hypothetical protein
VSEESHSDCTALIIPKGRLDISPPNIINRSLQYIFLFLVCFYLFIRILLVRRKCRTYPCSAAPIVWYLAFFPFFSYLVRWLPLVCKNDPKTKPLSSTHHLPDPPPPPHHLIYFLNTPSSQYSIIPPSKHFIASPLKTFKFLCARI